MFQYLVAIQIAIMVLSPTAIANSTWSVWTLWGNGAVMIVAVIVVLEFLFRNRSPAAGASNYVLRLIGAYALMMAGLFVWLLYGDVISSSSR